MNVEFQLKHFVEFFHAGLFFNEMSSQQVVARAPEAVIIPSSAYAFRFYDQPVGVLNDKAVFGERENISGRFFVGGDIMTLDDVISKVPNSEILQSNMRSNRYERVIRCTFGNFQPFEDGDILLPAPISHAEGL